MRWWSWNQRDDRAEERHTVWCVLAVTWKDLKNVNQISTTFVLYPEDGIAQSFKMLVLTCKTMWNHIPVDCYLYKTQKSHSENHFSPRQNYCQFYKTWKINLWSYILQKELSLWRVVCLSIRLQWAQYIKLKTARCGIRDKHRVYTEDNLSTIIHTWKGIKFEQQYTHTGIFISHHDIS